MIPKIRTGNYFGGALYYNLKKIRLEKAVHIGSFGFKTDTPDYSQVLEEFKRMLSFHPIKNPVWHTSINFAPEDQLDDDQLLTIVRDYLDRMGFGKSPYVIFKHTDTSHLHVHVLSICLTVDEKGKYRHINDSNNFFKSKKICADIERKYGLVISAGRRKARAHSYKFPDPVFHNYGEVPTFEYLKEVVDYVLTIRKPIHLFDLNQMLKPYSIVAFSNIAPGGGRYYKFSFMDKEGKSIGVAGTVKKLKLDYTSKEIENLLDLNRQELRTFLNDLRQKSKSWLQEYFSISSHDLEMKLKSFGLHSVSEYVFCDEKSGRQFEVTYLGLPKTFIKKATVRRAYYKAFMRTVTSFRRENKIFYESFLINNPDLLDKLKAYSKIKLDTLSKAQINVLFEAFVAYKTTHLDEILDKEKAKDTAWINKVIIYANSLNINYGDRIALLKGLGIYLAPQGYRIYNSMDQIEHQIEGDKILPLKGEQDTKGIYTEQLNSFTPADWEVIKTAISGRYLFYREANYKALAPFLPDQFKAKLPDLQKQYKQHLIRKHFDSFWPGTYDLHSGKLLKWNEDDDDEEEEEDNKLGKKRSRR